MKYYTLVETIINDTDVYNTIDIQSREQLDIISMFQARKDMLLKTKDVNVIVDTISDNYDWGFVRVVLSDGKQIELKLSMTQLV